MTRSRNLVVLCVFLVGALLWFLRPKAPSNSTHSANGPLVLYCAAGIKPPVEAAALEYEKAYGVPIQIQYGGSGTLLSSLRVADKGDLFLAADETYLHLARTNKLLDEIIPLSKMVPVIAVPRGNPKDIRSIKDLLKVRVALANPDAAAVGRITRRVLTQTGTWNALEEHASVFKPTVNDVANDVRLGTVDAGIIWDATARQYPELDLVEVPAFTNYPQQVAIGVLHNSPQPAAALRFARYLGAPEKGLRHFTDHGYQPVQGDAWAETPQVVLFSGGINRLAVEETIRRFEEREGVEVVRVYNGCGILVSQMKAGQQPDAYFACDTSFLTDVSNLFHAPLNISQSAIVLLVPKDNPRSLHTLADLAKPGLRVGVANEQQSALGALTVRLLKTQGLTEKVMANVKVQTPTADLLVNQIRTGSLDAVVVYEANTSQVRDTMSVVRLEGPGTTATQPYAVGRNSSHPLLMARLRNAIRSAQSRERFESVGFLWHADSRE